MPKMRLLTAPKSIFGAQFGRNASRLVHHVYGPAEDVVQLEHLPDLDYALHKRHVVVDMKMAPINPADLNMIAGTYPIRYYSPLRL